MACGVSSQLRLRGASISEKLSVKIEKAPTWSALLGLIPFLATYHAFDFGKYAHRYLGEYQYRFNRRFDLTTILPRLIYAAANTGSCPERWLRLAEDQC